MNEAQTRLELIDPALRAAGWTDENGWHDSFDAVQYWFDAVKKPRYYKELAVNRQDDPLSHRSGVAAGARGHGAAFLDKHPPKGRQEGVLAAPRCVDEPRRAGCAIQRLDPETIRTDVIPIVVVVSRAHHAEPETREERQRPVASGPIPAADHDILRDEVPDSRECALRAVIVVVGVVVGVKHIAPGVDDGIRANPPDDPVHPRDRSAEDVRHVGAARRAERTRVAVAHLVHREEPLARREEAHHRLGRPPEQLVKTRIAHARRPLVIRPAARRDVGVNQEALALLDRATLRDGEGDVAAIRHPHARQLIVAPRRVDATRRSAPHDEGRPLTPTHLTETGLLDKAVIDPEPAAAGAPGADPERHRRRLPRVELERDAAPPLLRLKSVDRSRGDGITSAFGIHLGAEAPAGMDFVGADESRDAIAVAGPDGDGAGESGVGVLALVGVRLETNRRDSAVRDVGLHEGDASRQIAGPVAKAVAGRVEALEVAVGEVDRLGGERALSVPRHIRDSRDRHGLHELEISADHRSVADRPDDGDNLDSALVAECLEPEEGLALGRAPGTASLKASGEKKPVVAVRGGRGDEVAVESEVPLALESVGRVEPAVLVERTRGIRRRSGDQQGDHNSLLTCHDCLSQC